MTLARVTSATELQPAFRGAVVRLLELLRAGGHEPVLHETYRSPERAAALIEQGRSKIKRGALSMHTLRIAADVICGKHKWSCGKEGCDFYARLGAHAERLGMTWGGRFPARDLVHVQGVPVALQGKARRCSQDELSALVISQLKPSPGGA